MRRYVFTGQWLAFTDLSSWLSLAGSVARLRTQWNLWKSACGLGVFGNSVLLSMERGGMGKLTRSLRSGNLACLSHLKWSRWCSVLAPGDILLGVFYIRVMLRPRETAAFCMYCPQRTLLRLFILLLCCDTMTGRNIAFTQKRGCAYMGTSL